MPPLQFAGVDLGNLAGVYVAVQRSEGLTGTLIASATAPGRTWQRGRGLADVPSHARIGVRDLYGARAYMEMREWSRRGWEGPFPEARAQAWAAAHPRRWIRIYDLDRFCGPEEAQAAVTRMIRYLPLWRYSGRQNWRIWLAMRFGRPVPVTPHGVNCSEAGRRLLDGDPAYGDHPLLPPRGCWSTEPDATTPYSLEQDLIRLGLKPI